MTKTSCRSTVLDGRFYNNHRIIISVLSHCNGRKLPQDIDGANQSQWNISGNVNLIWRHFLSFKLNRKFHEELINTLNLSIPIVIQWKGELVENRTSGWLESRTYKWMFRFTT